jgi:hypothetical protein
MPDQDAGGESVIRVITDGPPGMPNAFYMDTVDKQGRAIAPLPALRDVVAFDVQDGLIHRCVRWAGRVIRQREASFDWLAKGGVR